MSDTPRYIISTELNEYLCSKHRTPIYTSLSLLTDLNGTDSEWSKFVEQQNPGVAVPSDGTFVYINAAFQVVDHKQFLLTSIRLGLQYEDVPTTPLQVQ